MIKLFILTISILFSTYTFSFSESCSDKNILYSYKSNKMDFAHCVWPPCDDEI